MNNKSSNVGWNLDQGLAAQYAAQAGIDPDLAAAAGEAAWDALKALRDAADERDPKRWRKGAAKVHRLLSKAGLKQHGDLRQIIQQRLRSLAGAEDQSVNPETGLQEFFLRGVRDGAGGKMKDRLTSALEARLGQRLPTPTLDDRIATPKPEHTKEYWNDKLLHDQGGRVAMAQRVVDAASQYRGGSPEYLNRAGAIAAAVTRKYTPTGITAQDTPTTPEEVRDLYLSQGVNPEKYEDAPLTSLGEIGRITLAKTPEARELDPLLAKKMVIADPLHSSVMFRDENNDLRNRVATAETNDPLYPAYRSVNDWYGYDSENFAHKGIKKYDQFFRRGARLKF